MTYLYSLDCVFTIVLWSPIDDALGLLRGLLSRMFARLDTCETPARRFEALCRAMNN